MRPEDKKKEEEREAAYKRGLDDALRGDVTYEEGVSAVKEAYSLSYTKGFADGLRAKAGFL